MVTNNGVGLSLNFTAKRIEKCDGVNDHWFWALEEWGYEDGSCYDSEDEALREGQTEMEYQVKMLLEKWSSG